MSKGELIPAQEGNQENGKANSQPIDMELDPQSALPVHLQNRPYDNDIWNRIKQHPMRNPTLFQKKLDEDTESREIIRQVMAAAHQRESEILLHNQARVFRHVLGRVVSGIGNFLNQPMIPSFQRPTDITVLPAKATAVIPVDEDEADDEDESETGKPPKKLTTKSIGVNFLKWCLTPKYLGFAVLALLGIATGWSQLEMYHLRRSISAYEASTKASDSLQVQMDKLAADSENQLAEMVAERDRALGEQSDLRAELDGKARTIESLTTVSKFKDEQIKELKASVAEFRGDLTDEKKKDAETIEQLRTQLAAAQKSLADTDAQLKITKGDLTRTNSLLKETGAKLQAANGNEASYISQLAEKAGRINELQAKEHILRNADACIASVKREINKRWGYDHERVKQFVKEYEIRRDDRVEQLRRNQSNN